MSLRSVISESSEVAMHQRGRSCAKSGPDASEVRVHNLKALIPFETVSLNLVTLYHNLRDSLSEHHPFFARTPRYILNAVSR